MNFKQRSAQFCQQFDLTFPVIQGGMIWVSTAPLASAVARSGGMGVIAAGSLKAIELEAELKLAKNLLQGQSNAWNRLAVNLPLIYRHVQDQIDVIKAANIKTVITSAGSPKLMTESFHQAGIRVIHVCSSLELAVKCEEAKVDAVVVEGVEAGGHNGREELTTMVLIPQVSAQLKIPVIAAGGIFNAETLLAVQIMGACGAQMGTRFLMTQESAAHPKFKEKLLAAKSIDTAMAFRKQLPVRLLLNTFAKEALRMEAQGATKEELEVFLGKGRARLGMREGELEQGELEIGQVIGSIEGLSSATELINEIKLNYEKIKDEL